MRRYVPSRLLATALLILGPLSATAQEARTFVPGFEDLPLMPGLAAVEGSAVVFDKPDGRIAEAAALGRVTPAQARSFYTAALPQLGWQAVVGGGSDRILEFRREDETLQIEIRPSGELLGVRFFLSPR